MYMKNTLICIFAIKYVSSIKIIHFNLPKVNTTGVNSTTHLGFRHIKKLCTNRETVCISLDTEVCAVRKTTEGYEYRKFNNSCYLFLSNMCDYPSAEFSIARSGACASELTARRMYVYSGVDLTTPPTSMEVVYDSSGNVSILRHAKTTKFKLLYKTDTAFDDHPCPLSCPDVYSPVCVSANRGMGKYFKYWTFENHCAGDLYYCKNLAEFDELPPGESAEDISVSPLAWSFCGAHRYVQFARFSEAASAMGHYGWLQGDFSFSHIMEPAQRKPGFG